MLQRIWWIWPNGPPYGERENKTWNQEREKGFSLGRNAKRRREQCIAAFKKIGKEKRLKGCCLWENSQGGNSKMLLPLKEITNVCVRVKKNKRNFSLAVRHIQELL